MNKQILHTCLSVGKLQQRLDFLSKCKEKKVLPNCCVVKINAAIYNRDKVLEQVQFFTLNLIVKGVRRALKKEVGRKNKIIRYAVIPQYIYNKVCALDSRLKQKYSTKFAFLARKQNVIVTENNEAFLNLSNKVLPESVVDVLKMGPRYVGGGWKFPDMEIIADIEAGLPTNAEREAYITQVAKSIKLKGIGKYNNIWNTKIKNTKQFLQNENLVVMKEDKGNRFILMERNIFSEKMNHQINRLQFQKVTQFSNKANRDKFISSILRTNTGNVLSKQDYFKLYPSATILPRTFANAKTHKQDTPLRLMLDFGGVHYAKTAGFINRWLIDFLGFGKYTIKSSFDFISRIESLVVPPHVRLATMDIAEMYGSIDRLESIKIIDKKLKCMGMDVAKVQFITNFLNWLNMNLYSTFENQYYYMKNGWPMGLPLSGVVASIVVGYYEDQILPRKEQSTNFLTYLRYVDDVFMIADYDTTMDIKKELQEKSGLQFSIEWENDSGVAKYLDLHLQIEKQQINYKMIMKPPEVRGHISPDSNVPMCHKLAGLTSFLCRNSQLCRFESDRKQNIATYRQHLINVGFKPGVIDNRIKRWKIPTTNNKKTKQRLLLPYISHIHRKFYSIFNQDFQLSFHTPPNSNQLINNTKDRIPSNLIPQAVYKIVCPDPICQAVYYGETRATLETRLSQHKYTYAKSQIDPKYSSIFAQHQNSAGHHCEPLSVSLVNIERNDSKRKIKEACYISADINAINRKEACFTLSRKWNV